MSQITRCPACATQFKVASDQLRASEGWVRCGQCDEIFDAVAHLVPLDAFPVLSQVVPAHRREPVPGAPPPSPSVPAPAPEAAVPLASTGPTSPPPQPAPVTPALAESEAPAVQRPPDEPQAARPMAPEPAAAPDADVAEAESESESEAGPSPIDDFASQLRQALDFPPPVPVAADPESDEGSPEPEEPAEDDVPAIELDFPAFAPADEASEAAEEAWEPVPGASPAAAGENALDNAVDSGVLGAKLAFPDDARHPTQAEESDLLAERMAAEMDEVVLHLHESAEEPPVPDWMAQASAVADAPAAAAPSLPLATPGPASPAGQATLPPMAMPPLGDGGMDAQPAQADREAEFPEAPEPVAVPAPEDDAMAPTAAAAAAAALAAAAGVAATQEEVPAAKRWARLGARVALGMATLVLTLGLLAQAAVQWREPLLAWSPRALPGLQALCAPFKCTLAAPRGIADLVIDASGFRHLQDDRYELSLALQNRAKTPLAMPALELTLTDAKDQAQVRRVLQPADLGAPAELPPGERWEATVPLVLTAPEVSVASYRLLAFYP